jgi:hypothetical protein
MPVRGWARRFELVSQHQQYRFGPHCAFGSPNPLAGLMWRFICARPLASVAAIFLRRVAANASQHEMRRLTDWIAKQRCTHCSSDSAIGGRARIPSFLAAQNVIPEPDAPGDSRSHCSTAMRKRCSG